MRIKIIALSILLASCSSMSAPTLASLVTHKIDIQQGNLITAEMREKIKLGMTTALVKYNLGTPLINDPFHANRWDYVYSFEEHGKRVGRQRLTLYFEDDHLARIDDSELSSAPVPVPARKIKE